MNTIHLPFPAPSSFGSNSFACVTYNAGNARYEYVVIVYSATKNTNINAFSCEFKCSDEPATGYASNVYCGKIVASLRFGSPHLESVSGDNIFGTASVYRMWWYPSVDTHYNFSKVNFTNGYILQYSSNPLSYTFTFDSNSAFLMNCTQVYNGATFTPIGTSNVNVNYIFTGGSEMGEVLSKLQDINSSTQNGFQNVINQNKEIIFYTSEILNELKGGEDFTTAEDTTNQVVNDYDNAEQEVIGDSFDKLDQAGDALPDLNNFNSGNQKNAFQFISSNIEFFSGMNGTGSVSKIATVMFVILGLGLASFIIGLTNRRKGQYMFMFSFVNCQPFVYLIGALVVASIFGLISKIWRG